MLGQKKNGTNNIGPRYQIYKKGKIMNFFENEKNKKLEEETEQRKTHYLWVEKYRPLTLDSFIGNDLVKEKMLQYIKDNSIPHLLFYGKAGGGKTTLSQILIRSLDCDSIYINASSETGIENVRNKITSFASSVGFKDLKIIVLDEADFLSGNALAALRNVMETFSTHTRFILTCNYVERIIEPIISRSQVFELVPPSKKDIAVYVNNILRRENVESSPNNIALIINSLYPDVRRIINTLQLQTVDGKLIVDKKAIVDSDYKLKILEVLKDSKKDKKDSFREIRQIITDNSISKFDDMYRLLFDSVDDFAKGHMAPVILVLAEMEYKSFFVVDKEINFIACIIQLLNEIR